MWERSELKNRAKTVLNLCYWKAVLISFILIVITGGGSGGSGNRTRKSLQESNTNELTNGGILNSQVLIAILGIVLLIFLVAAIIGFTIGAFVFNPIEVNARRFFIFSRERPTSLTEIGYCFSNSYFNVVKIQFMRKLFTGLWTLLFIIPGIVKGYEYRMIPYLLAENPGMPMEEAFRLSKTMMDGEKWNTFVLDLSFLGWYLLSILTFGILAIFYVNPYHDLTNAELYAALKGKILGPVNEAYYK